MSDVTIRVRDNGPILVEGPIKLVDAQGNTIATPANKPSISLCRCGASNNKPFCDGAHKTCGFQSVLSPVPPPPTSPASPPA